MTSKRAQRVVKRKSNKKQESCSLKKAKIMASNGAVTSKLISSGDGDSEASDDYKVEVMDSTTVGQERDPVTVGKKRQGAASEESKAGEVGGGLHAVGEKLAFTFFDRTCQDLAIDLLGQKIVTMIDGKRVSGTIVETEVYLGGEDKAAHSYQGKRTARNEAMYMGPGTAYVYNIYGMYCCINISSQGDGAAVLVRALQPTENLKVMDQRRTLGKPGASFMKNNGKGLCNGPSKLCQALGITKDKVNQTLFYTSDHVWLERGHDVDPCTVVKCSRINIDYAEDWKDKPLRFYVLGNQYVSVRNKEAEANMSS
ncbi:3MG-like protein [Mya arenaria]|uniref:DNA-3-methyladenine glycosylase II n=1 Tax=Mya arenaria TaxID=6604 RepID=A0ABY7DMZ4_MYAAR|nr:uncharacterized protein LOC128241430 [Mya arenaria]WAQ97438.1 3MG-like protein [Mya arenaria]